jgi:hypothetical protein
MAKILVSSLKSRGAARPSKGCVIAKRVPGSGGQTKILRKLDVGSSTFGTDLQYVFRKNVAKARRDSKRTTGSTDAVVTKR